MMVGMREGATPDPEGNTMTATHTARAADRARTLAAVLTHRAATRPDMDTFRTIATLLIDAAHAFEDEEPFTFDGVIVTNCMPFEASMALLDAGNAAEDDPTHTYLRDVVRYVAAPITRRVPELPNLALRNKDLARRQIGLATRIAMAVHELDTADSTTTRYAILGDLLDIHAAHAALADADTPDTEFVHTHTAEWQKCAGADGLVHLAVDNHNPHGVYTVPGCTDLRGADCAGYTVVTDQNITCPTCIQDVITHAPRAH